MNPLVAFFVRRRDEFDSVRKRRSNSACRAVWIAVSPTRFQSSRDSHTKVSVISPGLLSSSHTSFDRNGCGQTRKERLTESPNFVVSLEKLVDVSGVDTKHKNFDGESFAWCVGERIKGAGMKSRFTDGSSRCVHSHMAMAHTTHVIGELCVVWRHRRRLIMLLWLTTRQGS